MGENARKRAVKSEPRAYHHGNLRQALLDAALSLFERRGDLDFTLRELARQAGVTHNAPYRHFASKADLRAALTDEGLSRLAAAERAALLAASEDPRARVRALGEAYIRFAFEQPTLFRLVLTAPVPSAEQERAKGSASYRLLEASIESAQSAGVVRRDLRPKELALGAWAFVHGVATLLTSGRLPATSSAVEKYVALLSTMFFEGASPGLTAPPLAGRGKATS